MNLDRLLGRNIPDPLLRKGVRRALARKLKREILWDVEAHQDYLGRFVEDLKSQPIAIHTEDANRQHYEVPPAFFETVLGRRMKYSCGYWPEHRGMNGLPEGLDRSEEDMLALTCRRAQIKDGQNILELGCGWGTLCLYMAETYPGSRVTAVSNSESQIDYIREQAAGRGLDNLTVMTADINGFEAPGRYDRVVSVEMFEHMRNYELLMNKVAGFLTDEGKLFVHIFTHRSHPFLYEDRKGSDWMTRYFFSGGTMPSQDLLHYFAGALALENQWALSGIHYQKTLEAWLQKMDSRREDVMVIFRETYGGEADKWWNYWRLFFLACAEFFGYDGGNQWYVSHYLFSRTGAPQS